MKAIIWQPQCMKSLSREWERRVAFGKKIPPHGLDLEKRHIFWANRILLVSKISIKDHYCPRNTCVIWLSIKIGGSRDGDSKSVNFALCCCTDSLEKKEHSMGSRRGGGSAGPGHFWSLPEGHLWAVAAHRLRQDNNDSILYRVWGHEGSLK